MIAAILHARDMTKMFSSRRAERYGVAGRIESTVTTMTIQLSAELEAALKEQANAHGLSLDGYVREVLERNVMTAIPREVTVTPFRTGRGMFAKYGQAPSFEEMEANRTEMFRHFGEDF